MQLFYKDIEITEDSEQQFHEQIKEVENQCDPIAKIIVMKEKKTQLYVGTGTLFLV